MKKQVLKIEQMQHLRELGLELGNTMLCWRKKTVNSMGVKVDGSWFLSLNQPIIVQNFLSYEQIQAFTLEDVMSVLPKTMLYDEALYKVDIWYNSIIDGWCIGYYDGNNLHGPLFRNKYMIDVAYDMLCYCIENGFVKTKRSGNLNASEVENEQ